MARQGGLSYRLARISILFAVLIGTATSVFEIWRDFHVEKERTAQSAEQVLLFAEPSAAEAAYQLDDDLAQEVISGLLTYPFVTKAMIIDDRGVELGRIERPEREENQFWVTRLLGEPFPMYKKELRGPSGNTVVGEIAFTMSLDVALSEFYDRLLVSLLTGVFKAFVLTVILIFVFVYLVGKPLTVLSSAIRNINPQNARPVDAVGAKHSDDEIGVLQTSVNRLLESCSEALENLENARRELLHNETRMSDFARAGSDWFWETDADHMPIFASEGFFKASGRDPETYLDEVRTGLINNDETYVSRTAKIRTALATLKPFRDLDLVLEKSDGGTARILSSGVPIFDESGVFKGFRGISSDRTDLQESESERERLTEDLNHALRLKAIGQLTGGIAHDFNNLLSVIMGCVEAVQSENGQNDIQTEALDMALDATKRGAVLTHRLLAYSRQQPLSPKPTDPKQVLGSLDDLLRRSLGETVDLEFVVNGGVWRCFVDQQELETVILNLAINARDAMPNGGKLTIEAFNARLDEEYAMSGFEVTPGQYVCFAVTDSGIGMDEDTVKRAFDPYFTTKAAGQGSGLGLSMAFGFVKQSNGHIKIYSEPGDGTTVKVYLPRTKSEQTDSHNTRIRVPNEELLRGRRILVVEDDTAVRRTVELRLARSGCEITKASDPAEALEKCAANPGFDLFLLDVVLPGPLKGPELAESLLDVSPGAAVVFMSGYTENAIVHGGQLDEGVRLLQKPFSSTELKAMLIRALLEGGPSE